MPAEKRWTHRIQFHLYDDEKKRIADIAWSKSTSQAQLLRSWMNLVPLQYVEERPMKKCGCCGRSILMNSKNSFQFGVNEGMHKQVYSTAKSRGIALNRLLRSWILQCFEREESPVSA